MMSTLTPDLQQQIEQVRQKILLQQSGIVVSSDNPYNSAAVNNEVGIIIPPPELKPIVERTAKYVAEHGAEFEQKLIMQKAGQPKFYFLKAENPYHAYYRKCIHDYARQEEEAMQQEEEPTPAAQVALPPAAQVELPSSSVPAEAPVKQDAPVSIKLESNVISKKADVIAHSKEKPKSDPLPHFYGVTIPIGMTPMDLDIIKITAQFAAKNGRPFLNTIAGRESRNHQFEFLKPTHRFHPLFMKLVEIYKAVIFPQPEGMKKLEFLSKKENKVKVLEKVYEKAEWDTMEQEQIRKQQEHDQAELEAAQSIDWYDFAVVETIDFAEDEEVVEAPVQLEDQIENSTETDMDIDEEMEVDEPKPATVSLPPVSVAPAAAPISLPQVVPTPSAAPEMGEEEILKRLKKNYKKPGTKPAPEKKEEMVKDPVSGKLIPISQAGEHLRVQLLDPRWKEQKQRELQKFETTNIASNDELTSTLFEFAKKRTDIFGKDEVKIGKAVGEAEASAPTEKVIWDGHSASIPATASAAYTTKPPLLETPPAFPIPPPVQMYNIPQTMAPFPPQPMYLPPPVGAPAGVVLPPPPTGLVVPPPMFRPPPPPAEDLEPSAKKARITPSQQPPKNSEQSLQPEHIWLQKLPKRKISIRVNVPKVEGKEQWGLTGQEVILDNIDVGITVNDLKDLVFNRIGTPQNKQKFLLEGMGFLRETQSLAYYNFSDGQEIVLGVKERTKKKK